MRIGSQQNLITIQRRVQVGVSDLNEPNWIWKDWRPDVFCELDVRRGKEQFDPASRIRYSEEVWRFRTRYDEVIGIDAAMRVLHEGQAFDIKAVLPDAQKREDCIIECTIQDAALQSKPLDIAIEVSIPSGVVGEIYQAFTVSATGGAAPYAFSAESGTLPPGLDLNANTGDVTGTPLSSGAFSLAIQVTDAAGAIESLPAFLVTIEEP